MASAAKKPNKSQRQCVCMVVVTQQLIRQLISLATITACVSLMDRPALLLCVYQQSDAMLCLLLAQDQSVEATLTSLCSSLLPAGTAVWSLR